MARELRGLSMELEEIKGQTKRDHPLVIIYPCSVFLVFYQSCAVRCTMWRFLRVHFMWTFVGRWVYTDSNSFSRTQLPLYFASTF